MSAVLKATLSLRSGEPEDQWELELKHDTDICWNDGEYRWFFLDGFMWESCEVAADTIDKAKQAAIDVWGDEYTVVFNEPANC